MVAIMAPVGCSLLLARVKEKYDWKFEMARLSKRQLQNGTPVLAARGVKKVSCNTLQHAATRCYML